ncbi:methyltransferase domain-containing protein [Colletotrichum asianum]|uniref:Methyltransferase domain-containing protein n=1 Tax=Colletotrichum asianum TaxID=702518 RepID=A0A8H3ZKC8_9PEZI|nr:methyltransferase domain-containing protein [Colletotrichum asianum]
MADNQTAVKDAGSPAPVGSALEAESRNDNAINDDAPDRAPAFGQLTSPMSTPEAEVLGVEHTPIQNQFVPPNGKFEVDDIEQPWAYGQPLDYIHIRGMTSSISDWPAFVEKVYNGLASGCYIELFEGHARN